MKTAEPYTDSTEINALQYSCYYAMQGNKNLLRNWDGCEDNKNCRKTSSSKLNKVSLSLFVENCTHFPHNDAADLFQNFSIMWRIWVWNFVRINNIESFCICG